MGWTTYTDSGQQRNKFTSTEQINNKTVTTEKVYDATYQNLLSESWSDGEGNSGSTQWSDADITFDFDGNIDTPETTQNVHVITTSNTSSQGSETRVRYYTNDGQYTYLGGEDTHGDVTLRLNASGEIISRSINPNNITDQLTAADLPAYTIFGAAKYKVSDSWSDGYMTSIMTTYYDATCLLYTSDAADE